MRHRTRPVPVWPGPIGHPDATLEWHSKNKKTGIRFQGGGQKFSDRPQPAALEGRAGPRFRRSGGVAFRKTVQSGRLHAGAGQRVIGPELT